MITIKEFCTTRKAVLASLVFATVSLSNGPVVADEHDEKEENEPQVCRTEQVDDATCPTTGKRFAEICYQGGRKVSTDNKECVS